MKFGTVLSWAVGLGVLSAVTPITIDGNAFWDQSNDTRFYIRGVDYQPGGSSNLTDPLADPTICDRDIPIFRDLGINTIRVYSVDNSQDHSYCMQQLNDNGMYLVLDVNTPDSSISRSCPSGSYNADYLQNVFATIDEFSTYNNTLAFFAGNENINDLNSTDSAPYVKAVVRDMKRYMAARDYRAIPVGYSSADIASIRVDIAQYFNCGNDSDARIDFLGMNDYSWCGRSSFTVSGYREKVSLYSEYSIPMFLSEYGCNQVPGARPFTEVASIYSTQMSGVFSGGLVYEYSDEGNHYGLVEINNDSSVTRLEDFTNLQQAYQNTPNPAGDGGYSNSYDYSVCPDWNVTNELPEMPEDAQVYFEDGAGEGYGFDANTMYCDYNSDDDDVVSSEVSEEVTSTSSSSSSSSSSSASSSATSSSATSSSSSSRSAGMVSFKVPSFITFFEQNPISLLVMGAGVVFGAAMTI